MNTIPRWVNLDGMLHLAGDTTFCNCERRKPCPKCGGIQHWQPCYGGYIELCEKCPEDADRWSTGPLPKTDGSIIE